MPDARPACADTVVPAAALFAAPEPLAVAGLALIFPVDC